MAEAIPRRARMAICRNTGDFISGDMVGVRESKFPLVDVSYGFQG